MFGVAQLQPVGAQELTECSDLGAQSMHAAGSPNGLMACDCLSTLTRLLPLQKLACSIDGTSSGISHVHGTRRLLLLWVRDCMSRTRLVKK